jgi:hypothetical protein
MGEVRPVERKSRFKSVIGSIHVFLLVSSLVVFLFACDKQAPTPPTAQAPPPVKITYLKKASDEVISFCSCGDGRVSFPAQMDCPWCGCGWLFSCMTCHKAFTFAEGVEIEGSWEDLAREEVRNKWKREPEEDDIASWVEGMKEILANVELGKRYVIIDGNVIPVDATGVKFNGWHARHEFAELPQVQALSNKSALDAKLGQRGYWTSNAVPEEE